MSQEISLSDTKRLKWESRWLSWPCFDKPFTGYSWIVASLTELLISSCKCLLWVQKDTESAKKQALAWHFPLKGFCRNHWILWSHFLWQEVCEEEIVLTRGRKINITLLTKSAWSFEVGLENAFYVDGNSLRLSLFLTGRHFSAVIFKGAQV